MQGSGTRVFRLEQAAAVKTMLVSEAYRINLIIVRRMIHILMRLVMSACLVAKFLRSASHLRCSFGWALRRLGFTSLSLYMPEWFCYTMFML